MDLYNETYVNLDLPVGTFNSDQVVAVLISNDFALRPSVLRTAAQAGVDSVTYGGKIKSQFPRGLKTGGVVSYLLALLSWYPQATLTLVGWYRELGALPLFGPRWVLNLYRKQQMLCLSVQRGAEVQLNFQLATTGFVDCWLRQISTRSLGVTLLHTRALCA